VHLGPTDIAAASDVELAHVADLLRGSLEDHPHKELALALVERLARRTARLEKLGLAHLQLARPAPTLSSGEARRLHLATQLGSELSGVAYVLDEPGAGAHVSERERLATILDELRARGNSVFLVEHDPIFKARADHVVEIGPEAGHAGGELMYAGAPRELDRTLEALTLNPGTRASAPGARFLVLEGARENNLQSLTVRFLRGGFNVCSGVSGAGKTTLVETTLARALAAALQGARRPAGAHVSLEGLEGLTKLVLVDQKEIARSSRSNPATYSGAFDRIRTLFAETEDARAAGFGKGRFSFNKEGGRCTTCEGSGVETLGLMSLPEIVQRCSACEGRRFDEATLAIRYAGRSIREVLELTVEQALSLFQEDKLLTRILESMCAVGLGYLQLGQGAPTLSGGEAQRLKLAKELARTDAGTVLVLDEPTTGLHPRDIEVLDRAFQALLEKGVTLIAVEHDPALLARADWIVDLGPGSGPRGGRLVAQGPPAAVAREPESATGAVLAARCEKQRLRRRSEEAPSADPELELKGVRTRNLKDVNVSLAPGRVHAVTGVSGSGKSALVFDTLGSLGRNRFAESFSPHLRRELIASAPAELDEARGLRPTLAIRARERSTGEARSTVGTLSGLDEPLRILFSRVATASLPLSASHFSFRHTLGACPRCDGRGTEELGDLEKLIEDPGQSILEGALEATRGGRFLFEREGRHHAVLLAAAAELGYELAPAWAELPPATRDWIAKGSGERKFEVNWEAARARGEATHLFTSTWIGVERLLSLEYAKKRERKLGPALRELLREVPCTACDGERLAPVSAAAEIAGLRLPALRAQAMQRLSPTLASLEPSLDAMGRGVLSEVRSAVDPILESLLELGLGHLSMDRRTDTLSSGERRRLGIATQLLFGLRDATYVLDEPCLGLHARDREQLVGTLRRLAEAGNTVCCVEHDLDFVSACDRVLDLGPGAGPEGGRVLAEGTAAELANEPSSLTGRFLAGERRLTRTRPSPPGEPGVGVRGASLHHLAKLDLSVELGRILGVCGVSGSGKSTLVLDVLAGSLETGRPTGCKALEGTGRITELVRADAPFHGAGPGSLVATALGVLDPLRSLFARGEDAKRLGLGQAAFSPTSARGRCPDCRGAGEHRIVFDFLPDASEPCRTCGGTRFNELVRECRWNGHPITELFSLPISDLLLPLAGQENLIPRLERLCAIGLGHLSLGRRFDSLSHGERQRLRLVRELARESAATGKKLFVFDEPSGGLHLADQARLLHLLEELVGAGHGVVFTDHSLSLLRCADRLVELGPGAAEDGGRIVFDGTPEELEAADTPTGRALRAAIA